MYAVAMEGVALVVAVVAAAAGAASTVGLLEVVLVEEALAGLLRKSWCPSRQLVW